MARKSRTKYAILGMLDQKEMCGYDMIQKIKGFINNFWSESHGQLYPTLAKLLKEELITCITPEEMRPTIKSPKVYKITSKGRKVLHEWLELPIETLQSPRNELLLKLYFSGKHDTKGSIAHLEYRKVWAQKRIAYIDTKIAELKAKKKTGPSQELTLLVLEHGLMMRKTEIEWCNKAVKVLKK